MVGFTSGNAGWLVFVEPLLRVQRDKQPWVAVLAGVATAPKIDLRLTASVSILSHEP